MKNNRSLVRRGGRTALGVGVATAGMAGASVGVSVATSSVASAATATCGSSYYTSSWHLWKTKCTNTSTNEYQATETSYLYTSTGDVVYNDASGTLVPGQSLTVDLNAEGKCVTRIHTQFAKRASGTTTTFVVVVSQTTYPQDC